MGLDIYIVNSVYSCGGGGVCKFPSRGAARGGWRPGPWGGRAPGLGFDRRFVASRARGVGGTPGLADFYNAGSALPARKCHLTRLRAQSRRPHALTLTDTRQRRGPTQVARQVRPPGPREASVGMRGCGPSVNRSHDTCHQTCRSSSHRDDDREMNACSTCTMNPR